ncbi:MAG: hypothetical protein IJN21_03375 [Clostridia bacterium]|nr:hypothetical protein [Clostridia bacterium]
MQRFNRIVGLALAVVMLFSNVAFASQLTAGDGAYGAYIGKDASIYQTWYTKKVVAEKAEHIVGVYNGYVYFETLVTDEISGNAICALKRAKMIDASDIEAEENFEQSVEVIFENIQPHAILDPSTGFVYYVDAAVP